jgi:hypothetical protein
MEASAQGRTRSQTSIPVRKDQPAAEVRVDTVRIVRVDTVTVRGATETVTVTRVDTVRVMEMIPLKRLAETFFGVGGGVMIPANRFNDNVKRGWDVQAQLGHYFGESPLGIRADVNYGQAKNRETNCATCPSTKILTGDADVLLRFPLDRKSHLNPILYALGGGNVTKFTDFVPFRNSEGNIVTAGSNTFLLGPVRPTAAQVGDKSTFWGYNVGGGLEIDVAGAHMFAETKYTVVNTTNGKTHYFPLVVGFNFY